MPIPPFTVDGILPPFIGAGGPGGPGQDLSPYQASAEEVVTTFGVSPNRRDILERWLDHRARLRAIGLDRGFQWLDGSFIEQKEPNDLDIVTFLHRPQNAVLQADWSALVNANLPILLRADLKQNFRLDAEFVDLNGNAEFAIDMTRYYALLFSHRRPDYLWKGNVKGSFGECGR